MNNFRRPVIIRVSNLLATVGLMAGIHPVTAQGVAFSYQGKLNEGASLASAICSVNLNYGNVVNGNARWLEFSYANPQTSNGNVTA